MQDRSGGVKDMKMEGQNGSLWRVNGSFEILAQILSLKYNNYIYI
jgi:hypothetical protein